MECITEAADMHVMDAEHVQSLHEIMRQVTDYRHRRGRRYEAATVLVLLLLAKLAGEKTISGVAEWARLRETWLKEALGLKSLPCANTYHYICAHLDMVELNAKVRDWLAQIAPGREPLAEDSPLEQWAIDGKVLRGSHRHTPTAQGGQEVLGVYAVETGTLQHCQMIAGKGYEAATAYAFVSQTDCSGIVITADALHTRPRFCRRIRKQKGHYLLLVKRNRAQLEAEIRHLFALPPAPQFPVETTRTEERGHGRHTIRQLSTSTELNLALADEWKDVAQVLLLERHGTRNGKPFFDSVCGVTSVPPELASPAQLLAWIRAYWHIENRSHWRRDATLGEDACTVRHPLVASVLAVLNAMILAIFDYRKVKNARSAIRTFDAFPDQALALLTQPL